MSRALLLIPILASVSSCSSEPPSPLASDPRAAVLTAVKNPPDVANHAADSIIDLILAQYDEASRVRLRPLLADRRAIVQLPDRPAVTALLEELMVARRRNLTMRVPERARDSVWIVMRDSFRPASARAIVLVSRGVGNRDSILVRPDVTTSTVEAALGALDSRRRRVPSGSQGTKRLLIMRDGSTRRGSATSRASIDTFLRELRAQPIIALSDSVAGRVGLLPRGR